MLKDVKDALTYPKLGLTKAQTCLTQAKFCPNSAKKSPNSNFRRVVVSARNKSAEKTLMCVLNWQLTRQLKKGRTAVYLWPVLRRCVAGPFPGNI